MNVFCIQSTCLLYTSKSCDGFTLQSTKYQSFGVGLPFLPDEGEFKQVGKYFILDNINRRFKTVDLRTGLGTELTLIYHEKKYPIYHELPLGCKVELKVLPYYRSVSYTHLDVYKRQGLSCILKR